MDVLQNFFVQITLAAKWLVGIQLLYIRPSNNSDDLCLLFCLFPSSMPPHHRVNIYIEDKATHIVLQLENFMSFDTLLYCVECVCTL